MSGEFEPNKLIVHWSVVIHSPVEIIKTIWEMDQHSSSILWDGHKSILVDKYLLHYTFTQCDDEWWSEKRIPITLSTVPWPNFCVSIITIPYSGIEFLLLSYAIRFNRMKRNVDHQHQNQDHLHHFHSHNMWERKCTQTFITEHQITDNNNSQSNEIHISNYHLKLGHTDDETNWPVNQGFSINWQHE